MAQTKVYRIAIMAMVLVALFALTTFAADITGGFGVINGVDETYKAAKAIINPTGDGLAVDTENAVTLSDTNNTGLAGLYAVSDDDFATQTIVYVYGDAAERAKLGNWAANASNKLMPTAEMGTEFKEGVWMSAMGSYNQASWGASSAYYPLTANYIQGNAAQRNTIYALTHTWDEAVVDMYATTNDYGYEKQLRSYYDKYYNYEDTEVPRVDEEGNPVYEQITNEETGEVTQGEQIIDIVRTYGDLKDPEAAAADLASNKTTVANGYRARSFKYALEPKEIIAVDELKTFPLYMITYQYVAYPAEAQAQVIFYVADKNGEVTPVIWTSDPIPGFRATTILDTVIDVQDIKGLPAEGWIVGVEIKPYGVVEDSMIMAKGHYGQSLDSQMAVRFYFDKYTISLPEAEQPENVVAYGSTFTGLDAAKTYYVAPVYVTGADTTNEVEVTGVTSYTLPAGSVGLYGLYVKGDGTTTSDSTPVLAYVMPTTEVASKLGSYVSDSDKTPVRAGTKETTKEWLPGTFFAANAWSSNSFRANDIYTIKLPSELRTALNTSDPLDEVYYRRYSLNIMKTVSTRYAYASDEIYPINAVKSLTFSAGPQNIVYQVYSAKPKVEIYVMNPNGKVTVHEWIGNGQNYTGNSCDFNASYQSQTVYVQNIPGIPSKGWIVGYKYYPVWDTALSNIHPIDTCKNGAFSLYMRTPTLMHPDFYVIDPVSLDAPTGITVEGTTFNGLNTNLTYTVAPFSLAGAAAEDEVTVTGVESYTLPQDAEGLYVIYFKGDGVNTSDSGAGATIYVAAPYSKRVALGTNNDSDVPAGTKVTEAELEWTTAGVVVGGNWSLSDSAFISDWTYYPVNADTLYEAQQAGNEVEVATLRANAKTVFASISFRYAFTPDEVSPIKYVNTMKFGRHKQNGGVQLSQAGGKLVLYVMAENGEISTYSATNAPYGVYTPGSPNNNETFDIQSFEGLPEEGYLVGYKYYPYANIPDAAINGVDGGDNHFSPAGKTPSTYYTDWYVLDKPKADAPTGIEVEEVFITGLDANKTYKIAPYTVNGANLDAVQTVTGVTECNIADLFANVVGLYGIYFDGSDEYAKSDATLIYLPGSYEARAALHEVYNAGDLDPAGKAQVQDALKITTSTDFVLGFMAASNPGYNKTTSASVNGNNFWGTLPDSTFSWGTYLKGFVEATTEAEKKAAFEIIEGRRNAVYTYGLTEEEIVPVGDVCNYRFGINMDNVYRAVTKFNLNNLTMRFDAYVMDTKGNVTPYTYLATGVKTGINNPAYVTVNFMDDTNWVDALPTEGYFVGYKIYPYYDLGEYTDVEITVDTANANYTLDRAREIMHFGYGTNYNLLDNYITPVVVKDNYLPSGNWTTELRYPNRFKVTNYSDSFEYEYALSDDNTVAPATGWTTLEGDTINANVISKYVWVKRLATDRLDESVVASDLPSEPIAFVGSQLVLDGNIGVKFVFNYDPELVTYASIFCNPDSADQAITTQTQTCVAVLDGNGQGYVVVPFIAKHASFLDYDNEFIFIMKDGTKHNMSSIGVDISVHSMVEAYKADAETYAEVLPLINALETYYLAAEDYFATEVTEVEALADLSEDELADLESKVLRTKAGTLEALEFYSTSLILEDDTAIRHYFKVIDTGLKTEEDLAEIYTVEGGTAFKLADVEEGTEDAYVYTDVVNIASVDLDNAFEVKVTETIFDSVTYTVKFNALAYVDLCHTSDNTKLANLVKALYRYSVESDAYAGN